MLYTQKRNFHDTKEVFLCWFNCIPHIRLSICTRNRSNWTGFCNAEEVAKVEMVQGLCQRLPREFIMLMHFDNNLVQEEIWKERTFSKTQQRGCGHGLLWGTVDRAGSTISYEDREQRKRPLLFYSVSVFVIHGQLTSKRPLRVYSCWISWVSYVVQCFFFFNKWHLI